MTLIDRSVSSCLFWFILIAGGRWPATTSVLVIIQRSTRDHDISPFQSLVYKYARRAGRVWRRWTPCSTFYVANNLRAVSLLTLISCRCILEGRVQYVYRRAVDYKWDLSAYSVPVCVQTLAERITFLSRPTVMLLSRRREKWVTTACSLFFLGRPQLAIVDAVSAIRH